MSSAKTDAGAIFNAIKARSVEAAVYADCLDLAAQIHRMFEATYSREPNEGELATAATVFIQRSKQHNIEEMGKRNGGSKGGGKPRSDLPADPLDWDIKFGPYKGKTWRWAAENEPEWVRDKIPSTRNDKLRAALEEAVPVGSAVADDSELPF